MWTGKQSSVLLRFVSKGSQELLFKQCCVCRALSEHSSGTWQWSSRTSTPWAAQHSRLETQGRGRCWWYLCHSSCWGPGFHSSLLCSCNAPDGGRKGLPLGWGEQCERLKLPCKAVLAMAECWGCGDGWAQAEGRFFQCGQCLSPLNSDTVRGALSELQDMLKWHIEMPTSEQSRRNLQALLGNSHESVTTSSSDLSLLALAVCLLASP